MSEKLCALRKIGGGTKLKISSFVTPNVQKETHGYGVLDLDVSKVKTLTIKSVTATGRPNLGSYGYIRVRTVGGSATIKDLSISNNPQTVDVTNYNEVELIVYFLSSSTDYAKISMNNITGE